MFARLLAFFHMRRSTSFLLSRADDRLLDDIGLSRDDLVALRFRLPAAYAAQKLSQELLRYRPA